MAINRKMDGAQQVVALIQHQHHLAVLNVQQLIQRRRRLRQRPRGVWTRAWVGRRVRLGIYHQLLQELRTEDPRAFDNFLRMTPAMFDELLDRLTPRLTKEATFYRENLEPGLKLAVTLRTSPLGPSTVICSMHGDCPTTPSPL